MLRGTVYCYSGIPPSGEQRRDSCEICNPRSTDRSSHTIVVAIVMLMPRAISA